MLPIVSYITVLTVAEGVYGNAKEGTSKEGALMISTEVLISTEVASLTVKLPYIPVDPEIVVDPEMNTGCNKGLTYDAVLEKDAETTFSTYEAVLLKEALTAFRM